MPARWNAVYRRIEKLHMPLVAEIGVYRGEMSARLLELHPTLRLVMIDAWDEHIYDGKRNDAISDKSRDDHTKKWYENYLAAARAVRPYGARGTLWKYKSCFAVEMFPDKFFDAVFIDAAHDYESVKKDILMWLPKVKKGGYIGGHDYGVENYPGVKKAVDEMFTDIELDNDFTWFVKI